MKKGYVYILTNKQFGVLYIGVTSNIENRSYQHKNKLVQGFSAKYNLTRLVYVEVFDDIFNAIEREKQLKRWRRQAKLDLICQANPDWCDLYKCL